MDHGDQTPPVSDADYVPPTITSIGSLSDLTQGQAGATDDLLSDGSQP